MTWPTFREFLQHSKRVFASMYVCMSVCLHVTWPTFREFLQHKSVFASMYVCMSVCLHVIWPTFRELFTYIIVDVLLV